MDPSRPPPPIPNSSASPPHLHAPPLTPSSHSPSLPLLPSDRYLLFPPPPHVTTVGHDRSRLVAPSPSSAMEFFVTANNTTPFFDMIGPAHVNMPTAGSRHPRPYPLIDPPSSLPTHATTSVGEVWRGVTSVEKIARRGEMRTPLISKSSSRRSNNQRRHASGAAEQMDSSDGPATVPPVMMMVASDCPGTAVAMDCPGSSRTLTLSGCIPMMEMDCPGSNLALSGSVPMMEMDCPGKTSTLSGRVPTMMDSDWPGKSSGGCVPTTGRRGSSRTSMLSECADVPMAMDSDCPDGSRVSKLSGCVPMRMESDCPGSCSSTLYTLPGCVSMTMDCPGKTLTSVTMLHSDGPGTMMTVDPMDCRSRSALKSFPFMLDPPAYASSSVMPSPCNWLTTTTSTTTTTTSMATTSPALPAPFLSKTFDLVDDPSTNDIVSWSPDGNSMIIWSPQQFCQNLLPRYFKHNNLSSFVRQLNTYGFRKVDPERWEFANDGFREGQPHLLRGIHRRKPSQQPPDMVVQLQQRQQLLQQQHQPQESWPSMMMRPAGSSSSALIEVGNFGLQEEIDQLRRDKNVLLMEAIRLRQQLDASERELQDMWQRLQATERQQLHMITFLARLMNNPLSSLTMMQQQHPQLYPHMNVHELQWPLDHTSATAAATAFSVSADPNPIPIAQLDDQPTPLLCYSPQFSDPSACHAAATDEATSSSSSSSSACRSPWMRHGSYNEVLEFGGGGGMGGGSLRCFTDPRRVTRIEQGVCSTTEVAEPMHGHCPGEATAAVPIVIPSAPGGGDERNHTGSSHSRSMAEGPPAAAAAVQEDENNAFWECLLGDGDSHGCGQE